MFWLTVTDKNSVAWLSPDTSFLQVSYIVHITMQNDDRPGGVYYIDILTLQDQTINWYHFWHSKSRFIIFSHISCMQVWDCLSTMRFWDIPSQLEKHIFTVIDKARRAINILNFVKHRLARSGLSFLYKTIKLSAALEQIQPPWCALVRINIYTSIDLLSAELGWLPRKERRDDHHI